MADTQTGANATDAETAKRTMANAVFGMGRIVAGRRRVWQVRQVKFYRWGLCLPRGTFCATIRDPPAFGHSRNTRHTIHKEKKK